MRFFLNSERVLGKPGTLLSLLKLLLSLPELGQVEGGDLLRLLDLLLVSLDLLLQLSGQLGHPVLVLLVLLDLEGELLDLALRLLVALLVLSGPALHVAKLNLQLANAALKLGHGGSTSTVGCVGRLSKLGLQLAKLHLHRVLRL